MASCHHYNQCTAKIGLDHICRIWLSASDSVPFSKRRPRWHYVKPAQLWSGRPGEVSAKCTWSTSKPVCKNHRAWFWQNTTSLLPASHFQAQLRSTDGSVHTVQNQPQSNNVWLTASSFGQADPVCKQAGVQEPLGPLLANAYKPNQITFKADPACLVYWEETC